MYENNQNKRVKFIRRFWLFNPKIVFIQPPSQKTSK